MVDWDGKDRRFPGSEIEVLSSRMNTLHNDVSDIKGTLKDLTQAINKLALVEERLSNTAAAQERTFKVLEKLEQRIDTLEKAQALDESQSKWLDRGIVALLGAAATYIWERIKSGG